MKKNSLTLLTLCFIVFIDFLNYGLIIPVVTPLFLDARVSFLPASYSSETRTLLLGFITAAYSFAQFFGAPIIATLSDKYGRKKMMSFTVLGGVVGTFAFMLGFTLGNLYILFLGRILSGLMGGNAALANSMVSDITEDKDKARNYGYIGLAMAAGIVLGPFFGGRLADPFFFNKISEAANNLFKIDLLALVGNSSRAADLTPFWLAAFMSLIAVVFVYFFLNETLKNKQTHDVNIFHGFKVLYRVLRIPNLRVIYVLIFLIFLAFNILVYSLSILLFDRYNFSPLNVGNFLAFVGVCIVISLGLINPIIAKKYKPVTILKVSFIILPGAFLLSLLPGLDKRIYYDLFGNTISFPLIYFPIPLLAIFYGFVQANVSALLSNNASDDSQGEAFGINQSIQSFVEGTTPVITSLLIAVSLTLPIIVGAIATAICGMIFYYFFVYKPHPGIKQ
jgi:DHA1 family tetracycline resistance protein-like MFS transporter